MPPVLMATCFRWSLVLIADKISFPGKCPLFCIILHSLTGSHLPAMLWPPVGLPSCVNCIEISVARQLERGTTQRQQITV